MRINKEMKGIIKILGVVLPLLGVGGWFLWEHDSEKSERISELLGYIAANDSLPGISQEDKYSFVKKTGIPLEINNGFFEMVPNPILTTGTLYSQLKRADQQFIGNALRIYQNDSTETNENYSN